MKMSFSVLQKRCSSSRSGLARASFLVDPFRERSGALWPSIVGRVGPPHEPAVVTRVHRLPGHRPRPAWPVGAGRGSLLSSPEIGRRGSETGSVDPRGEASLCDLDRSAWVLSPSWRSWRTGPRSVLGDSRRFLLLNTKKPLFPYSDRAPSWDRPRPHISPASCPA